MSVFREKLNVSFIDKLYKGVQDLVNFVLLVEKYLYYREKIILKKRS